MPRPFLSPLLALAAATSTHAQCSETFHPGPAGLALPNVSGGLGYATANYDPDGSGPLAPRLVIAGSFTSAGGVACNRIAQWDGTTWSSLGNGMEQDVYTLAVHNGELFAGGDFSTADGLNTGSIARWNGLQWSNVSGFFFGAVHALTVHQGKLIIARLYCDCYANCDGSLIAPLLTSNDFQCFLNRFAAGCN